MILWHKFPYVRILLFYLLGIFIAYFTKTEISDPLFHFIIIILVYTLLVLLTKFLHYQFKLLPGIFIGITFMVLGALITTIQKSKGQIAISSDQNQDYLLLITEEPTESEKSMKILGDVFIGSVNKNSNPTSTRCLIYFAKDSLAKTLAYGDLLRINTRFSEINPPQNPHEFNYRKYLGNRNIYHQAFLNKDAWHIIDHKLANPIKYYALKIRRLLLNILQNSTLSESEYAVASAILLGQDEILDDETRQDYAGAGATHVLCVSGLHVGIIFLAFNLLLGFLKKKGIQKLIKTLMLILFIWIYALITGFSPSVLRATVMLSFIILGDAFNKKGNIYNSIAASAFLLLLINPLMIMEVGFQLSYVAVIGIVSLYSLIKERFYHPNPIIDKIFSILIVSVAAQLGTFPLAIFYFHQFPVYFLLTNLVVILLATIIINFGFLYLLLSSVPFLSFCLQFIFKATIACMNKYVAFIESLPGSTLKGLLLSFGMMFIIYLLIIGITQSFLQKSKSWFVLSLLSIIILGFGFSYRNISQTWQHKMIVYKIQGHSVIEFQQGRKNFVMMDSELQQDQQKINYHLTTNWWYSGISQSQIVSFDENQDPSIQLIKHGDLFFFQNHTFLRINKDNYKIFKEFQIPIDYLIISNSPKIMVEELQSNFSPRLIILDSSNSNYFTQKIKEEVEMHHIPIYAVNTNGAYTIKL